MERRPRSSWPTKILRREPAGHDPLCISGMRFQREQSKDTKIIETADLPHPCQAPWICLVSLFVGKAERPRAQQRAKSVALLKMRARSCQANVAATTN